MESISGTDDCKPYCAGHDSCDPFAKAKLKLHSGDPGIARTTMMTLVWIGIYAAFLLVWLPHNTFYRLFYYLPC